MDLRERLTVLLVEPQYPGNVGAVARAMMNFGVTRLAMVNPCPITEEARDRAVHAQRVLDEARPFATFREAYDDFDYVVAFSARISGSDKSHVRNPVSLADAAPMLRAVEGRVALVFGREDDGLRNEEVEESDIVVQIPTHPMYPSMNLSHAVSVALYETFRDAVAVHRLTPASHREKELLYAYYKALLEELAFKPHRVEYTLAALRRVHGRGGLSRWEFYRIMGIVSRSLKRLGAWPVKDLPELPAEEADAQAEADADDPDAR